MYIDRMTTETKTRPMEISLNWNAGLRFEAGNAKGLNQALDGDTETAFSPTESLLASLCGCLAIDVVMILQRMRQDLRGFSVKAQGERAEEAPRYFRKVHLVFQLEGNLTREKVDRAINLSFDKYCSVLHSLRKDLQVSHRVEIQAPQT